jgi:predicted PurR-regulated permease PerM
MLVGGICCAAHALRDDALALVNSMPKAARQMEAAIHHASHDPRGWLHNARSALMHVTPKDPAPNIAGSAAAAAPVNALDWQTLLLHGSLGAASALASIGVVLFLVYFLLLSDDHYKRQLLTAFSTRLAHQQITLSIVNGIGAQLPRYVGVLAVTNAIIGVLTGAIFYLMGVEHASVWGVLAAVLHVIPYLGPAIIAAGATLAVSAQFESLSHGLLVGGISIGLSVVVGMLLATWLTSRASSMNSAAVFIGLLFWSWMWGIAGLLLSTPIMMAMTVIADRTECLHWVGAFLGENGRHEPKLQSAGTDNAPALTRRSRLLAHLDRI